MFTILQSTADVYSSVKENEKEDMTVNIRGAFQHFNTGFKTQGPVRDPVLYLAETGQVIRSVGPSEVPEEAYPQGWCKVVISLYVTHGSNDNFSQINQFRIISFRSETKGTRRVFTSLRYSKPQT